MSWNVKSHEMLMLMLDLWPQAETPGVTHFGAYHRPPDGHFLFGTTTRQYVPQDICWINDYVKIFERQTYFELANSQRVVEHASPAVTAPVVKAAVISELILSPKHFPKIWVRKNQLPKSCSGYFTFVEWLQQWFLCSWSPNTCHRGAQKRPKTSFCGPK